MVTIEHVCECRKLLFTIHSTQDIGVPVEAQLASSSERCQVKNIPDTLCAAWTEDDPYLAVEVYGSIDCHFAGRWSHRWLYKDGTLGCAPPWVVDVLVNHLPPEIVAVNFPATLEGARL